MYPDSANFVPPVLLQLVLFAASCRNNSRQKKHTPGACMTGGVVILTLKFMGTARDRGQMEQQLRQAFAGELEQGRVFWLLANTVCEQTWIAVKAGGHK